MLQLFSYVRQWLSSVLFVRTCPICGERVEGLEQDGSECLICHDCMHHLPRTEQASSRGNNTEDIFYRHPSFVRGSAFLFMDKDSAIRNVVHAFKYHRQPLLAYALAHEAALDYIQSDFFDGIDYIMPVPLHPRRLRQRGYNQSEYIARALSDVSGIPLDLTHLTRVVNNSHQTHLSGRSRQANVLGIFSVNHPEELYRRHILLVDDVLTTGSTLLSCMDALQACRGARFSVFVLGRAR